MTLSFKLVTLINRSYIKRLCGAARSIQSNAIPSEKALPFESVPEVKGLPVVGTLFEVIGHRSHAHELATRRFRKYGPVFREKAGPMTLVHICDVSDIETMCRLEGPWPRRIAVPCWNEWRRNQKLASGILIADGPDWKRMRLVVNKRMMRPLHVSTYTDSMNDVITDFIKRLRSIRDTRGDGVSVPDIDMELFHWSLESIGTVIYETRFGGLEDSRDQAMERFIRAVNGVFKSTEKVVYFPRWLGRLVVPKYQKLHDESWQVVFDTSSRLIEEKLSELQREVSQGEDVDGFLSYLLANDKLSREELVATISELMLGAVDTTSNTMQWVLYHLSRNPDVQDKLRQEVLKVTDQGRRVPQNNDLQEMPYLKAIIKEVLRLYPVTVNVSRILSQSLILGGYVIPEGTTVMAGVYYTGRDEANFPDPERFWPDRWLRTDSGSDQKHTFAWLPFGHGPRMCIGRRVAELEMHLLTARLALEFDIHPLNDVPLNPCTRALLVPERPVEVALVDRKV